METLELDVQNKDLELNNEQEQMFRQWARKNFIPEVDVMNTSLHPVIINELKIMCRQMACKPLRAISSVAIMRDVYGKVLLLNRTFEPMGYCLPGGHIEEDEDPMDACYREVLEETGMMLPGGSLRLVKDTYSNSGTHVKIYSCDCIVSDKVILSYEHSDFAFVDPFQTTLPLAGRTLKFLEGLI